MALPELQQFVETLQIICVIDMPAQGTATEAMGEALYLSTT